MLLAFNAFISNPCSFETWSWGLFYTIQQMVTHLYNVNDISFVDIGFIISVTCWKTKITEQFVSQFSTPAARLPCLLKADLNTFMRSLLLSFQCFLFKVFVIITVKKLSSLSWWSFTHCGEIISLITFKQWLSFRCVKLDQPLDAFLVCSRITRDRKLKVRWV